MTENRWFWLFIIPIIGGIITNFIYDRCCRTPSGTVITQPPNPDSVAKRTPPTANRSQDTGRDTVVPPQNRQPDITPTKYTLPIGADTSTFTTCMSSTNPRQYEGVHYRLDTVSPMIRFLTPLADETAFSTTYEACRRSAQRD